MERTRLSKLSRFASNPEVLRSASVEEPNRSQVEYFQVVTNAKRTRRRAETLIEVEEELSGCWTHPAGQAGLVESFICRNELGVTQQRHRQLGGHADLKNSSSRSEENKSEAVMLKKISRLPDEVKIKLSVMFLWFVYQLLDSPGGGSGGVVMNDQQHLLKVFVSRSVGLSRPGQVLTLRTTRAGFIREQSVRNNSFKTFLNLSVYQLQQEGAEVGPHPVRFWSVGVGKVDQVQEETLVDVEVLRVKQKATFRSDVWTQTSSSPLEAGPSRTSQQLCTVPVGWAALRAARRAAEPSRRCPP